MKKKNYEIKKNTPTGTRTQIYCLGGGYSILLNYGSNKEKNYLMVLPASKSLVGDTKANSPSVVSAIKIIP